MRKEHAIVRLDRLGGQPNQGTKIGSNEPQLTCQMCLLQALKDNARIQIPPSSRSSIQAFTSIHRSTSSSKPDSSSTTLPPSCSLETWPQQPKSHQDLVSTKSIQNLRESNQDVTVDTLPPPPRTYCCRFRRLPCQSVRAPVQWINTDINLHSKLHKPITFLFRNLCGISPLFITMIWDMDLPNSCWRDGITYMGTSQSKDIHLNSKSCQRNLEQLIRFHGCNVLPKLEERCMMDTSWKDSYLRADPQKIREPWRTWSDMWGSSLLFPESRRNCFRGGGGLTASDAFSQICFCGAPTTWVIKWC